MHAEWRLHPGVVQQVFNRLFHPMIDLIASQENAQLQTYCSWMSDPRAWAIDGLTLDWEGIVGYAYPPIALIPAVLRKVEGSVCRIL